jgi:hypothetical protein
MFCGEADFGCAASEEIMGKRASGIGVRQGSRKLVR